MISSQRDKTEVSSSERLEAGRGNHEGPRAPQLRRLPHYDRLDFWVQSHLVHIPQCQSPRKEKLADRPLLGASLGAETYTQCGRQVLS